MVHFLVIAIAIFVAFLVGVWLAPIMRCEYAEFKAYVESKIIAAEQAAKEKADKLVSKL